MKVTRMFHLSNNNSKIKAFAELEVENLIIKGIKIIEGKKGLFVGMPSSKGKDGKYYDDVRPTSKEAREGVSNLVLEAFENSAPNQKVEEVEEEKIEQAEGFISNAMSYLKGDK